MELLLSPWLWLSLGVKLLFALSPALVRREEINLDGRQFQEARDMAALSAARGILATLPPVLLFALLEQSRLLCAQRVDALPTLLLFAVAMLLASLARHLPQGLLRLLPLRLVLVAVALLTEALAMAFGLTSAAQWLCGLAPG